MLLTSTVFQIFLLRKRHRDASISFRRNLNNVTQLRFANFTNLQFELNITEDLNMNISHQIHCTPPYI